MAVRLYLPGGSVWGQPPHSGQHWIESLWSESELLFFSYVAIVGYLESKEKCKAENKISHHIATELTTIKDKYLQLYKIYKYKKYKL